MSGGRWRSVELYDPLSMQRRGLLERKLPRKENGQENCRLQRDQLWLDYIEMDRFDVFLATSMGSRHLHASAFGFHLPAAGVLGRSHLRAGQCTHHRRGE